MKKGMLVFVYRGPHGDCTAGGITGKLGQMVLVGDGIDGPFEVIDGEPYLELRKKNVNGEYLYAVPVNVGDKGSLVGPMFGGNFVYTSDSRFRKVCAYPIPVHDRWESQSTYDAMSR